MNTTKDTQSTPPGYWFGVIEHNLRAQMREQLADLGLRRGTWRILHTLADGPATAEDLAGKLPPRRDAKGRRGRGRRGHDFGAGRRPGFGPRFGFASDDERRAFFDKKREQHGFAPFASAEEQHAFFTGMRAARFGGGWWSGYGHADHHDHHDRGHWGGMRAGRAESILDAFSERGWVTITDGVAVLTPEGRAAHDDAFERIRKLRSSVADGISAEDYATTMATLEAMARNLGWDGPKREADAGPEA